MTSKFPGARYELSKLNSSKWWFIRANAAKHPNLSSHDLEKFLCDSNFNVRSSAAKNLNISIEALEQLALDKSALVRCSVAQNLKTPIQCLEKLSCDNNEEVRASVAFNSNISAELSVSIKAKLTADLLKKYSKSKLSSQGKYNIAVNAATPLTKLMSIYTIIPNKKDELHFEVMKNICQQLMCNQDITVELLNKLFSQLFPLSANVNICKFIACHKNANPRICKLLAQSYSMQIRCYITKNPNITIKLLEKLLQDREVAVRISALKAYQKQYQNSENTSNFLIQLETATHPNTPPEKLGELVKSKWVLVRKAVAMHPHAAEAFIATKHKKASLTVLEKLAKDKYQAVKIAVAKNPKTPIEILESIIAAHKYNNKTSWVALQHLLERAPDRAEKHILYYYKQISYSLLPLILQHPVAPISLLRNKLRLLSWMERYTITQNQKTSRSILEILAKDANRVVRGAAKERLLNFDPPNPP